MRSRALPDGHAIPMILDHPLLKPPSLLGSMALLFFSLSCLWADKVIMKDGKIYEGIILGESDGVVVMRVLPFSSTPRFLDRREVLAVIRDDRPTSPPEDPRRYALVDALLSGVFSTASDLSLQPRPGLQLGGGFRIFPLMEIDGGVDWIPAIRGDLAISDGQTTRGYEDFYSYSGGFALRIFPFFRKNWKTEPSLLVGYQWRWLVPNASGDKLKGSGPQAGLGIQRPLTNHWIVEASFLYQQSSFRNVDFLGREGSFTSAILDQALVLSTGVSYRL